jgi:hypothetical protein
MFGSAARLLAGSLTACLVAGFAGCGGSSNTASTSAQRKQACVTAIEAKSRYHAAALAMGLNFFNAPLRDRELSASGRFRAQVRRLEGLTGGAQAAQLAGLEAALSQQEKVVLTEAAHNVAAASRYGAGLNMRLTAGLAQLESICSKAG